MSRPFTEFFQVQQVDWSPVADLADVRAGADVRTLSLDDQHGGSSRLLRYPAGWRREEDEALDVDEEFFVLAGELVVGERRYPRYAYGHLPAGYHRAGMSTPDGAVVLTFFSGHPQARTTSTHLSEMDERRLIEHIDALAGDWGGNFHPKFPPGAGRKWLRRDPVTGDETWVLGTMPLRSGRRPERHPVVEEMYLLAGELHGHVGTMRPGAYFWRPEMEWHGPFGSLTGNLLFFRTVGGPLSTEYTTEEVDFGWDPPYRPILPEGLVGLPEWTGPGCRCF